MSVPENRILPYQWSRICGLDCLSLISSLLLPQFVRHQYFKLLNFESWILEGKYFSRVLPTLCIFRNIHFNVVPTVFHIDHISQGVCKTIRTTFQCIVVLQLREEGLENRSQIVAIVMYLFRTISRDWRTMIHQNVVLTVLHTPEICGPCGKLSELHWNVSMSSNRGKKVLNSIEIGLTQDLRVQLMIYK